MIASVSNSAISNGAVAQGLVRPEAAKQTPGLLGRIQSFFLGASDLTPGGGIHLTCPLTAAERAELNREFAKTMLAA